MRVAVVLISVLFPVLCGADEIVGKVESDAYESLQIPDRWIPNDTPRPISSAREYPRQEVRSTQIAAFVGVYGKPSRLVSPKSGSGYSYLIYDLDGGYKMLVYVPSVAGSKFTAAQLFRADGEPEGPVLK